MGSRAAVAFRAWGRVYAGRRAAARKRLAVAGQFTAECEPRFIVAAEKQADGTLSGGTGNPAAGGNVLFRIESNQDTTGRFTSLTLSSLIQ